MRQKLALANRSHLPLSALFVRQGVPWPQGAVRASDRLSAADEQGRPLPCASRTLNLWPDGSVQWSLVDLGLDIDPDGRRDVWIEAGPGLPAAPEHPVRVIESNGQIAISNGLSELVFEPGRLLRSWTCQGRPVLAEDGFDVRLVDAAGVEYRAAPARGRLVVEEASPLCAVVRAEGRHLAADGSMLLDFRLRFRLTAGRPDVAISYHYHNLEPREPGIELRSLAIVLATALPPFYEGSCQPLICSIPCSCSEVASGMVRLYVAPAN